MKDKVKKIILIFICICYAAPSFAIDNVDAIKRGRLTTVFVIAKYNIPNTKKPIWQTGTGFVVDTKKSAGLIVVTNKHILQRMYKNQSLTPFEILLKINYSNLEPTYWIAQTIALHESQDIGLLYPVGPLKLPADAIFKKSEDKIYLTWKHNSFLLEDDVIDDSEVKEGLKVFFSGYPLTLGVDRFQNFPITRQGILAQAIPGDNELIIDGIASHGSSGSPVYCIIDNSVKLIGVQKGAYSDRNDGYDENGNLISRTSFNSGLSIVIKASIVEGFVHRLIAEGKYKGEWSD